MAPLSILVTGATGQQGGALARELLNKEHEVRALTRRPGSVGAKELERLGARIVQGDYEDRGSLEKAVQGVDAVFAVATPYEAGPDAEERQGKNLMEVVADAGVSHLVYSSVADADRNTGIPHFDNKWRIEQHIQELGIPCTVVAPVWFFENYFSPWLLPGLQKGALAQPMPPDRELQGIALENIAQFTALVLENRDRFVGKRFNIASDELAVKQYAEVISRASGRTIEYVEVPMEKVREMSEDMALMYEWFNQVGYSVDIDALRREYPSVNWLRFEEWAGRQNWGVLREAASA
jgi:uncharacterized protein YbjT (DUF2867 family)